MLEIKDLKVNIEDKEILKGINLKVQAGEKLLAKLCMLQSLNTCELC